ncbi:MAG: TrmB family transcriptional regulator [Acidimicrobiales bacterium]
MERNPGTIDRLVALGFSQYEAQAYVGLLASGEPMTGYALSNVTGVPQPKVYETLRRLARKGIAVMLNGEPVRFVALPPAQLLTRLDVNFRRRLADAELALVRAGAADDAQYRVFDALETWTEVQSAAVRLLDEATRHAYVSLNAEHADATSEAITRADARGVRLDVLLFAKEPIELDHGRVVRHASTDGVVYRHHQARHLAVVADSTKVLWALAPDGGEWDAVVADDALMAAAIKGYVRHDIYVQQIANEFSTELVARFGPALEELVLPQQSAAAASAGAKSVVADGSAKRTTKRRRRPA